MTYGITSSTSSNQGTGTIGWTKSLKTDYEEDPEGYPSELAKTAMNKNGLRLDPQIFRAYSQMEMLSGENASQAKLVALMREAKSLLGALQRSQRLVKLIRECNIPLEKGRASLRDMLSELPFIDHTILFGKEAEWCHDTILGCRGLEMFQEAKYFIHHGVHQLTSTSLGESVKQFEQLSLFFGTKYDCHNGVGDECRQKIAEAASILRNRKGSMPSGWASQSNESCMLAVEDNAVSTAVSDSIQTLAPVLSYGTHTAKSEHWSTATEFLSPNFHFKWEDFIQPTSSWATSHTSGSDMTSSEQLDRDEEIAEDI